uniref:Uncharacterized protein n=1 Tax=Lepeophtheirus salmonis TaxID=72036 RepID=A0A0K2UWL7_LEPSM
MMEIEPEVIPSYYAYSPEGKIKGLRGPFFNGVREVSSRDLTVGLFQRDGGFLSPILIKEKDGLGIRIQPGSSLGDIRSAIGSRKLLLVTDSSSLSTSEKTFKELHKFLELPPESRSGSLFTTIDFVGTKLETQVVSPRIVRHLDWADKAWPPHLRDTHFPNTQRKLYIGSKSSFIDFKVNPGGSSSWHFVYSGHQTHLLIPPTDDNLKIYEDWVAQKRKPIVFLPDSAKNILKVECPEGATLFIPGGWIHGTFNNEDSLVFGGFFMHSFGIEKQLQISFMEESLQLPIGERYPHFTEMLWYVLDRYIHRLLGKTHLDLPEEEKRRMKLERGENIDPNKEILFRNLNEIPPSSEHIHLTQAELQGIKFIVMYLHQLSSNKKNVPLMLPDPIGVIKDVRALVLEHKEDCPEKAITSKYILRWTENDDVDNFLKKSRKNFLPPIDKKTAVIKSKKEPPSSPSSSRTNTVVSAATLLMGNNNCNRRRRVRCKVCEACMGGDCQICIYCKDMLKYGGQGRMKQTCEKRRCLQPQLPICAFCSVCNLDGWFGTPKLQSKECDRPEEPPNLFECTVCLEIIHPACAEKTIGLGKINNELCNSWECTNCFNSGFGTAPSRIRKRKLSVEGEDTPPEETSQEY